MQLNELIRTDSFVNNNIKPFRQFFIQDTSWLGFILTNLTQALV